MTASRGLRELGEMQRQGGHEERWQVTRSIVLALPEIIAVVEAAEHECDFGGCHVCGYKPGMGHAQNCALVALDEKLNPTEKGTR